MNGIAPGATKTHALSTVLTPEIERAMLNHTPLKRLGEGRIRRTPCSYHACWLPPG